jgi:hypothetical protein
VIPGLFGVACLALGLYNVFGREGISAIEMLLALMLIAVGGIVTAIVVAWILFLLWLRRLRRNLAAGMENLARSMEYMATQGRSGGVDGGGPGQGPARTYEPLEVQAEVKDEKPGERKGLGEGKPPTDQ